jgi:hypothetical protein
MGSNDDDDDVQVINLFPKNAISIQIHSPLNLLLLLFLFFLFLMNRFHGW